MPCILYDSRTPHHKILCANTKLKKSELMNIDNLNYTYANVMQKLDQLSCGSFAIVFDIAFNINVEKLKYAVSKMRQHLEKNYSNENISLHFQKFDVCKIFFPK
jgi:hypothetical protein